MSHCLRRLSVVGLMALVLLGLVGASGWVASPRVAAAPGQIEEAEAQDAYLYLFDTSAKQFAFSYAVPTVGTRAWDVDVVSEGGVDEVWFTEPGADLVGCLVYTDTNDYDLLEYPVPSGSYPLNMAIDGVNVWFTEPGRNKIGKLDRTTGAYEEYDVPTEDSYPADLDVAPDGSVWFTEMKGDKIGHLVVGAFDYDITEYEPSYFTTGRPYGIVVVVRNSKPAIYYAETAGDAITYADPPNDSWVRIKAPSGNVPDHPFRLAVDKAGSVWATERIGNRVTKANYETLPLPIPYNLSPARSLPNGLIVDSGNNLWFAQELAGQIGYLMPTTNEIAYHPVPATDVRPRSLALGAGDHLWVLAVQPEVLRIYAPLILRIS
ncbi:MAG: virginiamycin B lyase family protein [Anaerolineae bacterium]